MYVCMCVCMYVRMYVCIHIYYISVQQMHNIFVNKYLFLAALLHVSMSAHHPQVIFLLCMLKLQIVTMETDIQLVVSKNK
jgi:hypothetical protein